MVYAQCSTPITGGATLKPSKGIDNVIEFFDL
jgi:hypothetical protein